MGKDCCFLNLPTSTFSLDGSTRKRNSCLTPKKKCCENKINFADTSAYAHRKQTTERVENKIRNMKNCTKNCSALSATIFQEWQTDRWTVNWTAARVNFTLMWLLLTVKNKNKYKQRTKNTTQWKLRTRKSSYKMNLLEGYAFDWAVLLISSLTHSLSPSIVH